MWQLENFKFHMWPMIVARNTFLFNSSKLKNKAKDSY